MCHVLREGRLSGPRSCSRTLTALSYVQGLACKGRKKNRLCRNTPNVPSVVSPTQKASIPFSFSAATAPLSDIRGERAHANNSLLSPHIHDFCRPL